MKYKLLTTLLIIIYPIFVGGNEQALELPQSNIKQKTKKSTVNKPLSEKKKTESKTLIVRTALKHFVLTYSKEKVAIKGYQMDLSLDRKKCNAHIIDRFNKETIQLIREALESKKMKSTVKKKEIDTVEIRIQGKSYFTEFSSRVAQTFLYYPKEVLRMKWEEKFNCEKKKKTQHLKRSKTKK